MIIDNMIKGNMINNTIKSDKIIKSEDAVSEVIGMVLVLSISMLAIGSIVLVGLPMIESGKNMAKMDIVANSFLFLQNDIEEVVRGPIWVKNPFNTTNTDRLGPSRETELELMEGALSVISNSANITFLNTTNTIMITPGNIMYNTDTEEIAYENGAVIRKYESGESIMISYPLISIYDTGGNTTISIHAITLNGTKSSVGGEGKAWAEIRLKNYTQIVEPTGPPNSNQTNIKIYTRYPNTWKNYFDMKLKGSGLISSNKGSMTGYNISGTTPLNIEIYGNVNNRTMPDIFLSVYESMLDVKVR